MRIGICAPYDLSIAGGVNTHIRAQANALRRLGHDVCVFGAASGPLPDDEVSLGGCVSMVVGDTETGFGVDPRSWWTARRLLRQRRFDLLHMHEPLMPLPPWFVLKQADVPVVATFHTYRSQGHRWYPKYRWIFDPLMARVSVRLAVSEAAKRTVAEHFPGEYEVVPNAIDVARFATQAPRPASMPAERRHVLYVGRIEPRKGVDKLVHAMSAVQERVAGVRLVIVGDGPGRAAVDALARTLRVDADFRGRVADADLAGYYQAADVVCSPALADESFGITMLEAMAAGRPIVASNVAGYAELLAPAGSARLTPVGDADALAEELCSVLTSDVLARTLGERGRVAARQYDWTAIAKRLEGIYELCLHELPVEGRRPQQLVVRP